MKIIFTRLDRNLPGEGKKVQLFLDNAMYHPLVLETKLKNIELKFLLKCITF